MAQLKQITITFEPKSRQVINDLKALSNNLDQLESDLPWQAEIINRMRAKVLRIIKAIKAK